MINNEVWELFNRYRGFVDANTFSDMMAYSLLLKYAELTEQDYYQNNFSVKYLSRLYGDIISEEELAEYIEQIERYYKVPVGLIAGSFRNTIRKFGSEREKQFLLDIFRHLSEIEFGSGEEIANSYDYFMEKSVSHRGRFSVECSTNSSLAQIEAGLLDIKEGLSIYDPFCGIGKTLVVAGKNNNPLFARDLNSDTLAIAVINMILHGCNIKSVTCGDSLFADDTRYDRIVSEPPLNAKYLNDVYDRFKRIKDKDYLSKDALEIDMIIDSLENDGKAVILVPAGFLFRGGKTQDYRKHLLDENLIDCILNIPAGVISGIMINTSLLVINKKKDNKNIVMFDSSALWEKENIRDLYMTNSNIDKIINIISKREEVVGLSKIITSEEAEKNNYNLSSSIYVTPYSADEIEVKDINELISRQKELEKELAVVSEDLYRLRNM